MKLYGAIVLLALVAVAIAEDEFYSGKWNDIDTHVIIDNARSFKKYKECIVESATTGCPPEALDIKKVIGEALKTTCAKCSPEQQTKIKDTLQYMCTKRPEETRAIFAKLDPKGEYRPQFEGKFGKINGNC